MDAASKYRRIYTIVRQIPSGKVATYGDVAALAALPGQARLVGYALHALPPLTDVPWQRVINAKGGISIGRACYGADLQQRRLLEEEGIVFKPDGTVSLEHYRWRPSPLELTSSPET